MNLKFYQVDAFTKEALGGNPAAVFFLDEFLSDELMQKIAREMNLSETAFVVDSGNQFDIRFFTPTHEAKLCGHATLSAAHLIYGLDLREQANFVIKTTESEIAIRKHEGRIAMEMPLYPLNQIEPRNEQIALLGFQPLDIYTSFYNWKLVVAPTEEYVHHFVPNEFSLLQQDLGHLILTAKSSLADVDFIMRCFAPEMGILEDPVTGSSLCALAPFWSASLNKSSLTAKQVSDRGGLVYTQMQKNNVLVCGDAITVIEGDLRM